MSQKMIQSSFAGGLGTKALNKELGITSLKIIPANIETTPIARHIKCSFLVKGVAFKVFPPY
jgi:hypothetical protein